MRRWATASRRGEMSGGGMKGGLGGSGAKRDVGRVGVEYLWKLAWSDGAVLTRCAMTPILGLGTWWGGCLGCRIKICGTLRQVDQTIRV